jgi:hypothetical protein
MMLIISGALLIVAIAVPLVLRRAVARRGAPRLVTAPPGRRRHPG